MLGDFVGELQTRGLLSQSTDPRLQAMMQQERFTAYIGFDPTAASLHVGSLLQILALVRLQHAGHRPIAIVGGGTGLIGDPSGRAAERTMLTKDVLAQNLEGIRSQLERFLAFDGVSGAVLVNNADWLCELNLVDFLRDVGKFFTVNQMIARDSVKVRLESREQGLSFTEFSYALLQAYDFLALFDRYGCRLQLGGSDQWGNIVDGTDLIRRVRAASAFGITQPLITRADGQKFGKSEGQNVWLNATLTSPFEFYQFWLNADDSEVVKWLNFFTFVSADEIVSLADTVTREPEKRVAQRRLADEVTRLVHGDAETRQVKRAVGALFEGGDLRALSHYELTSALKGAPRFSLAREAVGTIDASIISLLVSVGFADSRGRARAIVEAGGVSLNNERLTDPNRVLGPSDLLGDGVAVLRRGRRTYCVVDLG